VYPRPVNSDELLHKVVQCRRRSAGFRRSFRVRRAADRVARTCASCRGQNDTLPRRSPAGAADPGLRQRAAIRGLRPEKLKRRSYQGSRGHFRVDILKFFFNRGIDFANRRREFLPCAEKLHPRRITVCSRWSGGELFLHGVCHKLLERLPAASRCRLGCAEQIIRNFQGGFHSRSEPCLWLARKNAPRIDPPSARRNSVNFTHVQGIHRRYPHRDRAAPRSQGRKPLQDPRLRRRRARRRDVPGRSRRGGAQRRTRADRRHWRCAGQEDHRARHHRPPAIFRGPQGRFPAHHLRAVRNQRPGRQENQGAL
jgi:hypothetical protein